MTNKVKPFYIRITDDMTPQMVQDAFDKCVGAGAEAGDGMNEAQTKYAYPFRYNFGSYKLFGVDRELTTRTYSTEFCFGNKAQEITLDQLDEWLRFEVEQGWKSGDECRYNDINWLFCGFHPVNGLAIVANNDEPSSHQIITVDVELLSKPETPEQKTERERLEAAYDLYSDWCLHCEYAKFSFADFCETVDDKNFWLSTVDKTNYRKQ